MKRLDTLYPGRVTPDNIDYPGGSFRNKSTDTSNDGTPIADAERLNNVWGALLAILEAAGLTPNDITEKTGSSQVRDAIFKSAAIGQSALSNDAVSAAKIQDNAVWTSKIVDNAITAAKIFPGVIDSSKMATNSIARNSIQDLAVNSSKLDSSSVVGSKIATGAVSNTKLNNDIQLDKISGGDLDIVGTGFERIQLDETSLKLGIDGAPNQEITRQGIIFAGTNNPGNLSPPLRWAVIEVSAKLDGSSKDSFYTGASYSPAPPTVDPHFHALGIVHTLSGAGRINTEIPWTSLVFDSTISYTSTGGDKVDAAPCKVVCENDSGVRYIKKVRVQNEDGVNADEPIDYTENIYISICYSGSAL